MNRAILAGVFALLPACGSSVKEIDATQDAIAFLSGTVLNPQEMESTLTTIHVQNGIIVSSLATQTIASDAALPSADLYTPGFVDAHAHPMGLGRALSQLDLTGLATYADTLNKVSGQSAHTVLQGRGWDQNNWTDSPPGGWPLATDLEQRSPKVPAILTRVDGHAAWLNTTALEQAGIDAKTPDPPGGKIIRDASGNPTGVLVDQAMELIQWPDSNPADRKHWIQTALQAMAQAGLTGAHAMGMSDLTVETYLELEGAQELPLHIWAFVSPGTQAAEQLLKDGPIRGETFHRVGIKVLADGALGSRGAFLSQPYADAPESRGLPMYTEEEVMQLASRCLAAEVILAVHAIGDESVHQTLNAFEKARKAHPDKTHVPLRIEHAQIVRDEDVARFKALHVFASMQPTHATSDMDWAEARLGPERIQWSYRWRDLLNAHAPLALGSDFPVEDVRPELGVWAALTRRDRAGNPPEGWRPEQRLTLAETVRGFTLGAAEAVGFEKETGQLSTGLRADMTLWRKERLHGEDSYVPTGTIVGGVAIWLEENTIPPNTDSK